MADDRPIRPVETITDQDEANDPGLIDRRVAALEERYPGCEVYRAYNEVMHTTVLKVRKLPDA